MSEKYKKPDYTVKNFDILNKHAEEGVAREKEITRLRRAQTNWQNAKNISLVLFVLGILALLIGKAIQIANQENIVELSQNHNHSSTTNFSKHDDDINNRNYSSGDSYTSSSESYTESPNTLKDSSKTEKSNLDISPRKDNELDGIKKENPSLNELSGKNNAQEKSIDEKKTDDQSIVKESSEKRPSILSYIFGNNESKDQGESNGIKKSDKSSKSDIKKPENKEQLANNKPDNETPEQSTFNKINESKDQGESNGIKKSDKSSKSDIKKPENKEQLANNKPDNETPEQSTFNKIYEQVYGEKFEPSKEVITSQDEFGNSIIIKEYIFKINTPQMVTYKNISYEVFTTYYFKSTEQDSLAYPMKQRCWAYTPAKIVLALSEKDNKNSVFNDKSEQGLALEKANLKDSDLVNFRGSCKFI